MGPSNHGAGGAAARLKSGNVHDWGCCFGVAGDVEIYGKITYMTGGMTVFLFSHCGLRQIRMVATVHFPSGESREWHEGMKSDGRHKGPPMAGAVWVQGRVCRGLFRWVIRWGGRMGEGLVYVWASEGWLK